MQILVPIFCGAILPIAIVLIVFIASMNKENKRANVLIKAIESDKSVDTDKLIEALKKPEKTPREMLNQRLLRGCAFSLVGLVLLAIGIYNYATLPSDFSNASAVIPSMLGGISLAIGVSYLVVFFVTRKQVEIEEKN